VCKFLKSFSRRLGEGESQDGMQNVTRESKCVTNVCSNLSEEGKEEQGADLSN